MWPPTQTGNAPTTSLDSQFQNLNIHPGSSGANGSGYPSFAPAPAGASVNGPGYPAPYGYPASQGAGTGYPAPSGAGNYPSVPAPAPGPQQTYTGMYAAPGSAPAPGYPVGSSSMSGGPSLGAGWTADAVQPATAAKPGQFGHYGHLQHAPSFNTATVSGRVSADYNSTSGAYARPQAASTSDWVLQGNLPKQPSGQLIGPFVRFNDYDPLTGQYALSVLVASHPSLASSTVQLHYAVNAPATQAAPSQILDDFMGALDAPELQPMRLDVVFARQQNSSHQQLCVGAVLCAGCAYATAPMG